MGRKIGYASVSTVDQDLATQKAALEGDGCAIIFEVFIVEEHGESFPYLSRGSVHSCCNQCRDNLTPTECGIIADNRFRFALW